MPRGFLNPGDTANIQVGRVDNPILDNDAANKAYVDANSGGGGGHIPYWSADATYDAGDIVAQRIPATPPAFPNPATFTFVYNGADGTNTGEPVDPSRVTSPDDAYAAVSRDWLTPAGAMVNWRGTPASPFPNYLSYSQGSFVTYNREIYRARVDVLRPATNISGNTTPDLDTTNWEVVAEGNAAVLLDGSTPFLDPATNRIAWDRFNRTVLAFPLDGDGDPDTTGTPIILNSDADTVRGVLDALGPNDEITSAERLGDNIEFRHPDGTRAFLFSDPARFFQIRDYNTITERDADTTITSQIFAFVADADGEGNSAVFLLTAVPSDILTNGTDPGDWRRVTSPDTILNSVITYLYLPYLDTDGNPSRDPADSSRANPAVDTSIEIDGFDGWVAVETGQLSDVENNRFLRVDSGNAAQNSIPTAQQIQARYNIGAAGEDEIVALHNDIDHLDPFNSIPHGENYAYTEDTTVSNGLNRNTNEDFYNRLGLTLAINATDAQIPEGREYYLFDNGDDETGIHAITLRRNQQASNQLSAGGRAFTFDVVFGRDFLNRFLTRGFGNTYDLDINTTEGALTFGTFYTRDLVNRQSVLERAVDASLSWVHPESTINTTASIQNNVATVSAVRNYVDGDITPNTVQIGGTAGNFRLREEPNHISRGGAVGDSVETTFSASSGSLSAGAIVINGADVDSNWVNGTEYYMSVTNSADSTMRVGAYLAAYGGTTGGGATAVFNRIRRITNGVADTTNLTMGDPTNVAITFQLFSFTSGTALGITDINGSVDPIRVAADGVTDFTNTPTVDGVPLGVSGGGGGGIVTNSLVSIGRTGSGDSGSVVGGQIQLNLAPLPSGGYPLVSGSFPDSMQVNGDIIYYVGSSTNAEGLYRWDPDSGDSGAYLPGPRVLDIRDTVGTTVATQAEDVDSITFSNKFTVSTDANIDIANDGIGNAQIAANAVQTEQINNGAVTTDKINDLAVTTGKLIDDAVTGPKIANNSVGEGHLLFSNGTTELPGRVITYNTGGFSTISNPVPAIAQNTGSIVDNQNRLNALTTRLGDLEDEVHQIEASSTRATTNFYRGLLNETTPDSDSLVTYTTAPTTANPDGVTRPWTLTQDEAGVATFRQGSVELDPEIDAHTKAKHLSLIHI